MNVTPIRIAICGEPEQTTRSRNHARDQLSANADAAATMEQDTDPSYLLLNSR
jgi:hypothetical protein